MKQRHWPCLFLITSTLLSLSGCGTMKIEETRYYAVETEDNTNVFRLQIFAESRLSETKYQSGFYSAQAVDRAFGNIDQSSQTTALMTQDKIESAIQEAVLKTTNDYLKVVTSSDSTEDKRRAALKARRDVLAYPSLEDGLPSNARIIDFNPISGIVTRNANSKMIFVWSSNPDDVIRNIKNFSESAQTALAVSRLAEVSAQRVRNEVTETEANIKVQQQGTQNQLKQVIQVLSDDKADKTQVEEQLKILRAYLRGI